MAADVSFLFFWILAVFSQFALSFQSIHLSSKSRPRSDFFRHLQMAETAQVAPPFEASTQYTARTSSKFKRPFGAWEELHGNWVLRPPSADEPPRAVLHFLGGALVGASPHITYRYMLERLAQKGYLIIATPYQLSFDHLETCDGVISRFELMAPDIARQYGAIPVIGIGHSTGALLQLLITSLFPDTPRAGNALLSFNNKPVTEAVPFFEEVFAPFFTALAQKNGTFPNSNEALTLGLQVAKAATEGKRQDSDAILLNYS